MLGKITGFLFGVLILNLAILGLAIASAIILLPFALPGAMVGLIFKTLAGSQIPIYKLLGLRLWILIGNLANGILYYFIGGIIQKKLKEKGKNEKIVLYPFVGIILLFAILILIEYLVKGGFTA